MIKPFARAAFFSLFAFEFISYINFFPLAPEYTWFGVFATVLLTWFAFEIFDAFCRNRRTKFYPAAWLIAVFAVYFDAIGDMLHLYGTWNWYDQIAHLFGGAVAMAVLYYAVRAFFSATAVHVPISVSILLAHGFTMTVSTLYEIEEYVEDALTGSHRLGDGPDTANDLMMNLIGATIVAIALWIYSRRKKQTKSRL